MATQNASTRAPASPYNQRTEALSQIIRPLRTARYETDVMFRDIESSLDSYGRDWGGLDLTPDFQRGHVWSPAQQCHYIENILRGVVGVAGLTIQLNCPNWEVSDYEGDLPLGMQCIDGLQRLTAVRQMMAGQIKPFGLSLQDLHGSSFALTRNFYCIRLAVHDFESRADLLQHYIDINSGGTAHSPQEIERVSQMLLDCIESACPVPQP